MKEAKLKLLNDLYERISAFPELIRLAEKIVQNEFNLSNNYENPLNWADRKIEDVIDEIRDNMVHLVIGEVMKGYNVSVDSSKIKELAKNNGFDAFAIAKYLEKKYLSRADEIAFQQILERAQKFLPTIYEGFENRMPDVEEIVKKNRLILRHYGMDWGLDTGPYLYNFLSDAEALEKLIRVVLLKEEPSKAHSGHISSAYLNANGRDALERKELYTVIKAIKIHKNHKVIIWLESEEDARRVAEVLLGKKNPNWSGKEGG